MWHTGRGCTNNQNHPKWNLRGSTHLRGFVFVLEILLLQEQLESRLPERPRALEDAMAARPKRGTRLWGVQRWREGRGGRGLKVNARDLLATLFLSAPAVVAAPHLTPYRLSYRIYRMLEQSRPVFSFPTDLPRVRSLAMHRRRRACPEAPRDPGHAGQEAPHDVALAPDAPLLLCHERRPVAPRGRRGREPLRRGVQCIERTYGGGEVAQS